MSGIKMDVFKHFRVIPMYGNKVYNIMTDIKPAKFIARRDIETPMNVFKHIKIIPMYAS